MNQWKQIARARPRENMIEFQVLWLIPYSFFSWCVFPVPFVFDVRAGIGILWLACGLWIFMRNIDLRALVCAGLENRLGRWIENCLLPGDTLCFLNKLRYIHAPLSCWQYAVENFQVLLRFIMAEKYNNRRPRNNVYSDYFRLIFGPNTYRFFYTKLRKSNNSAIFRDKSMFKSIYKHAVCWSSLSRCVNKAWEFTLNNMFNEPLKNWKSRALNRIAI